MRNYKKIYLFLLFLLVIGFNSGCHYKEDVKVSNEESSEKELADIEELAKNCAFNVTWCNNNEQFTSGTAFLMDSKVHNEKVLITAFHFLWPDDVDEFKGNELPAYIQGGEVEYCYSGKKTGATLKNCLVIEDADIYPNMNKDISAFTLWNADQLQTLPLATEECKGGETIYLLANLWDTDDVHENCVYEGKVLFEEDGVLYYKLDERYGTSGASGAPLVNKYGEVVGIHLSSGEDGVRAANAASSIAAEIKNAYASDITYPEELVEMNEIPIVDLQQDDLMETTFFNLSVKNVTLEKELNGNSTKGYQYLVLDLELSNADEDEKPVEMYFDDFYVEWGSGEEDYCYPLKNGLSDNQLPEEYVLYPGDIVTGQLIFEIPKKSSSVNLCYQDSYTIGNSDEIYEGDLYMMNINLGK